jgi:hypothetical protein
METGMRRKMREETMANQNLKRSQRASGVALILVILAILVLTTLAAAMVFSARTETLSSFNYRVGTQAQYVAEAGITKALNFFKSANYVPVPATTSNTVYDLSTYGYIASMFPLFFSNYSPVHCLTSVSGCSSLLESPVVLGTSASNSNYPGSTITNGVDVVANWLAATQGQTLADSMGGTGTFTVKNATLLEYHTVNNGFYGLQAPTGCTDPLAGSGICRSAYEVWKVTSVGTWNNNLMAAANVTPTVAVTAIISSVYSSYFGNALYGMCKVTLNGNVCTDSYDSNFGTYSSSPTSCVTPTSGSSSNASDTNGGIGANGGVTIHGSSATIGGSVSVADSVQSPYTSTCDTGYTAAGSPTVTGTTGPGPVLPAPTMPNMSLWGYTSGSSSTAPRTAQAVSPHGTGSSVAVANVYLQQMTPPAGLAGSCSPSAGGGYYEMYDATVSGLGVVSYSNYSCVALNGTGTSTNPYLLADIVTGTTGTNGGAVNIIAPTNTLTSSVYAAVNNITVGTGGIINTSSQPPAEPATVVAGTSFNPNSPAPTSGSPLVLDLAGNLSLGGTADMNYNPATPGAPSPDYLRMYIEGPQVTLTGQAQLSAVITAPDSTVSLGGSGASGAFFGSILGGVIKDSGGYPVHYDMAAKTDSGALFTSRIIDVTRPKM